MLIKKKRAGDLMIECVLFNNQEQIKNIPSQKKFNEWISEIKYEKDAKVSLVVVSRIEMLEYNKKYRNHDNATDVLSFPVDMIVNGTTILGDVIMCAEEINYRAEKYKKKINEIWAHLTIHSILHLLGHTHDDTSSKNNMEKKEIELLSNLGFSNPYYLD
tara:strand:- start:1131 stop:1610 length:480 start_codon:yes stop_codon:yes gene_type:complete